MLCVVKSAIRAESFSSTLVANWSVDVESTKRLSDTVRSQKPTLKFTRTFAGVYSEAVSTQDCVVSTRENLGKVRNKRKKNRLSGCRKRDNKSFFQFSHGMRNLNVRNIMVRENTHKVIAHRHCSVFLFRC